MRKRRIGLARVAMTFVLLVVNVGIFVASAAFSRVKQQINIYETDETIAHQLKWQAHNIKSYSITVNTFAFLSPSREGVLTFYGDEKLLNQTDNPECKPSKNMLCVEGIIEPYNYSITSLFQTARSCLYKVKAVYAACFPHKANDFQGFATNSDLLDMERQCNAHIDSTLCFVEFDAVYGYPRSIVWMSRNCCDRFYGFEITNFSH
jgi:hypothetical protein